MWYQTTAPFVDYFVVYSTYIRIAFGLGHDAFMSQLKGKPVKVRRYPRSCNPTVATVTVVLPVIFATVLMGMGRRPESGKPEDLPVAYYFTFLLSAERQGGLFVAPCILHVPYRVFSAISAVIIHNVLCWYDCYNCQ